MSTMEAPSPMVSCHQMTDPLTTPSTRKTRSKSPTGAFRERSRGATPEERGGGPGCGRISDTFRGDAPSRLLSSFDVSLSSALDSSSQREPPVNPGCDRGKATLSEAKFPGVADRMWRNGPEQQSDAEGGYGGRRGEAILQCRRRPVLQGALDDVASWVV